MKRFADEVVLVTGAGSGIGHATALAFAAAGARLVLCDLDEAKLAGTVAAVDPGRMLLARHVDSGPERVAAAIVAAVRRDRALVPVTPEAWLLYLLKRAAPGVASWLMRRVAPAELRGDGAG